MTTYTVPIVGAHFRPPAKAILAVLPAGTELRVVQEPENPYDTRAIAVYCSGAAIPQVFHQELEVQAQGYGFDLATILASDWHLGYIAAKAPKGYEGKLAGELFDRVSGAKAKLGFLPNGNPAVIVELAP